MKGQREYVDVVGQEFGEAIIPEVNQPIEAKLINRETVKLKKYKAEKTVYHLEVDGEKKNLWGSGHLDYLMDKVKDGSYVRITYLGKEKVKGMRQEVHKWKVEVAK